MAAVPTRNPNFASATLNKTQWADQWRFSVTGATSDVDAQYAVLATYPINTPHPDARLVNVRVSGTSVAQVIAPNSAYSINLNWEYAAGGSFGTPENLLTLPPRVESINYDYYQLLSEVDIYGDPICNSAGEPYDPPGTEDRVRAVLVISAYKKSYVGATYLPFMGKLNSLDYVLPGIGLVSKRKARCLTIRPANGFDASVTIAIGSITGTFTAGELVTWGSGPSRGQFVRAGSGLLVLTNPTGDVAIGNTFTGGDSGAVATATIAVTLPPIKIFWTIEWRASGFDYPVPDKGSRGWWTGTSGGTTLGNIIAKKEEPAGGSSLVYLRQGAPLNQPDYTVNNQKFSAWLTTEDKLAGRTGGTTPNVVRLPLTAMDQLTFKRIEEMNWATIGI